MNNIVYALVCFEDISESHLDYSKFVMTEIEGVYETEQEAKDASHGVTMRKNCFCEVHPIPFYQGE
jgi:hypothetical protein